MRVNYSTLMITAADVLPHLGISADAINYETTVQRCNEQIELWAMQLLEDYFQPDEVRKLSANQIKRAKNGLAEWIAAEVLSVHSKSVALKAGTDGAGDSGSLSIGPLHMGNASWGWAGSGSQLTNTQRMVDRMKAEARDILATLRVEIRETSIWQAV